MKKTAQIRDEIEETREHLTGLLDEVTAKLDVRSFAKRNAVVLGSAAVAVGLVVGLSVWFVKGTSGRRSGRAN